MNWIEEILIICGISLDIFGAMACKGAVVAELKPKRLAALCGLVALWQLAALALGALLAGFLQIRNPTGRETFLGQAAAAAIFFGLAARLLRKAWKNERVLEKREEDIQWKQMIQNLAAAGGYTLLAGAAFGFVGFHIGEILIIMPCISVAVVLLGMYTGYRLGCRHKLKAYAAGAALLAAAGIDVALRIIW